MRALTRHPYRHRAVAPGVLSEHATRLHRRRREPLLEHALLDEHVRFLTDRRVVGYGGEIQTEVVGRSVMDGGALRLERFLEVHHRRKLLVIDVDQTACVGRLVFGLSQYHCHGLALVNDLFLGDREARRIVLFLCHEGRCHGHDAGEHLGEVLVCVNGDDAWRLAGRGDVDALDSSVREWAPDHCQGDGAGSGEVVYVMALATDEAGVFPPGGLSAPPGWCRPRSSSPLWAFVPASPLRPPSWPRRAGRTR